MNRLPVAIVVKLCQEVTGTLVQATSSGGRRPASVRGSCVLCPGSGQLRDHAEPGSLGNLELSVMLPGEAPEPMQRIPGGSAFAMDTCPWPWA